MALFRRFFVLTLAHSTLLASAIISPAEAVAGKSGSGARSGGGGAASTSTTTAGRTTYGQSIGTINRYRVAAATTAVVFVWYYGNNYPATRFYYTDSYDDCAMRNVTATQYGLDDSNIDAGTLARLPALLAASNTSTSLAAFNETLYNTTNGLIVDPAYCNYTVTTTSEGSGGGGGGGASAPRGSLMLTVSLAAAAAALICSWRTAA